MMLIETEFGLVPCHVLDQIEDFRDNGDSPNEFCYSILVNNLTRALLVGDNTEIKHLKETVRYVLDKVPACICGNVSRVAQHIEKRSKELDDARQPRRDL
jgi:hypothetical protein